MDVVKQAIWKNHSEIELFKTPDGGTVGIEWSIDDNIGRPPTAEEEVAERKPILLLAPGLQN